MSAIHGHPQQSQTSNGPKDVLSELESEQIAQDHIDFLRSILESQTKVAGSLFMFLAQVNLCKRLPLKPRSRQLSQPRCSSTTPTLAR